MFKQWLDKTWPGKRAARAQWDAGLAWYRLRYLTPDGPTRCIRLLSRPQACGRVALYFLPGEAISVMYLGIPETHVRLLQRMAADFGFSLKPQLPGAAMSAVQRLTAVSQLPWERPFLAHVVNEFVFVSPADGERQGETGPVRGSYLPQPPIKAAKAAAGLWQLPPNPAPGLTARPYWNGQSPPAHLVATEPNPGRWLLGRSQSGIPLHVSGRINIYGRQAAVADWLVAQVTQMVTHDHASLIVIDGAGDLVPRLKRKAAVTRLLGEGVSYVDIDSASLVGGFNPLAAVPGETETAMVQRWQDWFKGMNVHPHGLQLLAQAHQAGVADLPALQKWLKQTERQGQLSAISSLQLALARLTASRTLREWLTWPTNLFERLPTGALFFACRAAGWDRQQLVRAVLLAALNIPQARLILHGFPWSAFRGQTVGEHDFLLVSNGPEMAQAATVLVASHAHQHHELARRFLSGSVTLEENLALLQYGQGILCFEKEYFLTSWLNEPK
ncbi:MAG: hypothetical protein IT327_27685 [Anaerolineae bacterium]|nr:hypothetical protein [Anaerolineae bacterium]